MTISDDIWDPCLKRLETSHSERDLSTWIRPLRMLRSGDHVTLLAPNRVVLDRVRSQFADALQRTLSQVAGYDLIVNIMIGSPPEAETKADGRSVRELSTGNDGWVE